MADLEGRTVLVLGGSSGIGLATARLAAVCGAKIVLASHHRERLEAAAPRIRGRVRIEPADLADEASIAALCG
jgi:NAD(P)-dependent dehydrogenase (short-subunit alcohol dehydrogenase family)